MNRLQDNLELKNRTAWTSVTIHTQTWSSEILPMQTEPWELGLEIARPYSSKSQGNLVRQIKYKKFRVTYLQRLVRFWWG